MRIDSCLSFVRAQSSSFIEIFDVLNSFSLFIDELWGALLGERMND
jgi:hypothetical protein